MEKPAFAGFLILTDPSVISRILDLGIADLEQQRELV